jgi:predicted AAA+ superfamily ATPase
MEFKRDLDLFDFTDKKSLFLFGPRATGKTSLIKRQLSDRAFKIDLLKSQNYLPLSQQPSDLESMIAAQEKDLIVIDEIQKIPALLDEVHRLIEEKKIRFLLTGSSARKLKRHDANMLGGRASQTSLFPLTWHEISQVTDFDLERYLRFGSLPRVYLAEDPVEELSDYVDVYLKEEIMAEAAVRNLPAFSRFLKLAALSSGEQLNYANIAGDVGLSAKTIRSYFEILDDTLLGFELPVWRSGKNRKAVATSKHYLFDCGVMHALSGTKYLDRNSDLYGRSFEHFILNEVRAYRSYARKRWDLSYWRTHDGDEVDLVIDDRIAIEFKSTRHVTGSDLKGLRKIRDEATWEKLIIVSQDPISKLADNILSLDWQSFLGRLWGHGFDA